MTTRTEILFFEVSGGTIENDSTVTVESIFTMVVEDDDDLGIGDTMASWGGASPTYSSETGRWPVVVSVSNPDYEPYVGGSIYFNGDRNVDGQPVEDAALLPRQHYYWNEKPGDRSITLLAFREGSILPKVGDTLVLRAGTKSPGFSAAPGNVEEVYAAICLARGTMIATPSGEIACEALQPSDLVNTLDHGPQPIRFVTYQHFDTFDLMRMAKRQPICIQAGQLPGNLPVRDLWVSRQHCVLLSAQNASKNDVLVPAAQLAKINQAHVLELSEIEYFNLLFDHHEVIIANGLKVESLFLGPETHKQISNHTLHLRGESAFNTQPNFSHEVRARPVLKTTKDVKKLLDDHKSEPQRPMMELS